MEHMLPMVALIVKCDYQTDRRIDRHTPDKVIPLFCSAKRRRHKNVTLNK